MKNPVEPFCFISPSLPPSIDGIGDYQRQLWRHWSDGDASGPDWMFLVVKGASESQEYWPEVCISQFDPTCAGLVRALNESNARTVVLQYVGYGFDNQGHPLWLPEGLSQWSSESKSRSVIVMFHETWASGYPWQRVFWQRGKQIDCARRLLDLSSSAVTSNNATLRDLRRLDPDKEIELIPLGSSFSVAEAGKKKWRQLLIFGREYSRLRAIRRHRSLIRKLANDGLLDRIVLAGESTNPDLDDGKGLIELWNLPVAVHCCFNFATDQLPIEVIECGLSLMHTESACLLKSTSFQLAAELGQVPIALKSADPGQPVFQGKHYLGYRPGDIGEILSSLGNTERLDAMSTQLSSLGREELSWPEIVRAWKKVFYRDRA